MEHTTVNIIQKPEYVNFWCPNCEEDFEQDFLIFMKDQGLKWSEYPNWEYEDLTCPKCNKRFRADFELD